VRQSIEAEAPTGSECEHGQGGGPCAEEQARPATSKHGPQAHKGDGKKGGRTLAMFDTLAVFQLSMFWLKAVALSNVFIMVVARAVFHEPMLTLNPVALENTPAMVVALAVFHEPMLPLKAVAP
jgi:hypothetical protein